MSQSCKVPLLRLLPVYLILSFTTSAAVITAPAKVLLSLPSNTNTNLTTSSAILVGADIYCLNPSTPGHRAIDVHICQPYFNAWLSSPELDVPKLFGSTERIITLTGPPCIIGLRSRGLQRPIILSLRQILVDVLVVLTICERFGRGGWTAIEQTTWDVVVTGGTEGVGLGNGTAREETA